ncbi:polymorphic toxin-type HINT domain-containing protein [Clostridium aminobutyricum]|uniref:Hint domain-containing protein n=1 Tax=Clostridium aminobutyricum TaxID=33953 RepID=A0A939D9R8_CLOAM|nr:polymorphic toxin-type HINT domain-containing protein [Clostridium aminobutyricum]MBN7773730.1 hypothetical protein [Clostridium aminobutyricum]
MKKMKKFTSLMLIVCLIFTSINFQTIIAAADSEESTISTESGDPLSEALRDADEEAPILNKAVINANYLTLNFDEALDTEGVPSSSEFKVRFGNPDENAEENTNSIDPAYERILDPVYTTTSDPVYTAPTDTTIYSVSANVTEISVYDNKVLLTLAETITSSGAVTINYTPSGDGNLKDKAGNHVIAFTNYEVTNITGGIGIPNFVAEEVYNSLDTTSLSDEIAHQLFYSMTNYTGSREQLTVDVSNIIAILSQPDSVYSSLTDDNKSKLCEFFRISPEFFSYSEEKGESVQTVILTYFKMLGYGLTPEEIQKSIQDDTRDQVMSTKEREWSNKTNSKGLMRAALSSTSSDPFEDVKYDKEKSLSAPFQHTVTANEQINLSAGTLNYDSTDAVLPGAGGLDLVIQRQYSTDDANYYDLGARLKYGKNLDSRMKVYEREYHFTKNEDGTMGERFEDTSYKLILDDFIGSSQLRGYYNQKQIDNKEDYYAAHLFKTEMTTDATSISAMQYTTPVTKNDSLWQLGTGWKFNFSYIDIDDFYYDYMKLHLSDGREFGISTNWVNNLGHYTYKDVIFAKKSKSIAGQTSSYVVTYADGKKEYFNSEGRLIAIVDRFGNTISFTYTIVNNMVEITITDTVGRITTIKNQAAGSGYNKVLTLPDGKKITYVINQNVARTIDKLDQYEQYPGQNNEYNLVKVINQEGEETTYSYSDIQCSSDFAARFKSKTDNLFMRVDPFDDGARYYPNFYAGLSKIIYPTGLTVNYEYYPRYNNWYDYGCIMDIAIKKRYDQKGSLVCNQKEYVYSNQYKRAGQTKDILYNADGYNNTLREDRCFDDWKEYWIQEKDSDRNIVKEYYFDPRKMGVCVQEKTYLGSDLKEDISNEYRVYNRIVHPSKIKITAVRSDTSDHQSRTTVECFDYDNKGNVINYWPALSDGNTLDTLYKVSMTYDRLYNFLLSKTYKRDANTIILEKNTPSDEGETIVKSEVYENGNLKVKSEYNYDTYGNVTQTKRYTNVVDGKYIQTDNTYISGTYLTGVTVQNIQDADGKNIGSVSGQATYDIYGRIATETDSKGNVTTYTYDALGRILKIQYPGGSSKTYTYNTAANQTTVTDERGYITQYQYDAAGNLTAVYAIDGGSAKLLKANEYDSLYRLTKEQNNVSEGGRAIIYSYDYKDRVTNKRAMNSSNTKLSQENYIYYDDKITKSVDGDENSKTIISTEYVDKYGRVFKKGNFINGSEVFTTFIYNYLGEPIKEKAARANTENFPEDYTTKYEYNFDGQVSNQYDVFGNYITTKYDATGNKISATDAKSNAGGGTYSTIYTYDSLGRLIKTETPFTADSKAITKCYYDANGNLVQKQVENSLPGTEANFTKVDYVYNAKNQLVQVKSYDGNSLASQVDYEYDAVGNKTAMTIGGNQRTVYEYDRYGNLISLTDPLGLKETYTYNINGNLTSKINKNGIKIDYTYDGLSRKLSQNVAEDGITQLETMGYTATGALAFSQNGNIRTDYSYDERGRLTKEADSNGIEKSYTYDVNGNLKTSDVKVNGTSKKAMTYAYDKKDRLSQVYESGKLVATYTYDINGNRSSLTYGNGDSADYAYNLANLVISLHNKNGANTLSKYSYTYYLDGNQAAKSDNKGRTSSYTYDGLGRLSKEAESGASDAITKAYTFDAAGNRATMAVSGADNYTVGYAYDVDNRLTIETKQIGSESEITDYYYDNNGNTIAKKTGILKDKTGNESLALSLDFKGGEVYQYDGFDRLIGVQNSSGSSIYTYKPDGLRLSKTVNGVTTTHIWEGQNISLELDANSGVVNRYIRGNGLINSDKNGWYLFNGHGDVVQLADNAGTVIKEYAYDAFGNEKNSDPNDTNPFRYCGEYFDSETGSIYLRARYYEPEIGRFLTEDTVKGKESDPLSLNLYTYCENNPVMYNDPSGNFIDVVLDVGFIAYDIWKIVKDPNSGGNWAALAADALCAVVPGLTGGGAIVRALEKADNLADVTKIVEKAIKNSDSKAVKGICFTGDTLIKTKSGHKKIEDITIGDKVYAENVKTREKGYKAVKKIFINEAYDLIHITVQDTEIRTTFPHPFYVVGKGWVEAKDLQVADVLELANGKTAKVEALKIENLETPIKVYNFEVQGWHTYYVSDSEVLVHNTGTNPCGIASKGVNKTERKLVPNDGKHQGASRGDVSADPFWNNKTVGQKSLNSAYSSTNTKQLYNVQDGKLVKFQPDNQGGWHAYEVINPAQEVPADILRQMKKDGLITNSQYTKFIKNK